MSSSSAPACAGAGAGAGEVSDPVSPFRSMLRDRLASSKFASPPSEGLVRALPARDVTVARFQKDGFENPILVADKADLDLKMPLAKGFSVADVRAAVGSRRLVDVVDCDSRKTSTMTLKDWHRYFSSASRTAVLNVLSLEFSGTKLDSQVGSPRIVRQIDWIDKAWPRHLKDLQVETTNNPEDMMYPKVQKYCLMSAAKAFTDFHVDCGGSSAWYHVLQGKKVFWVIPPSDENLRLYEEWILNSKQQHQGDHEPSFFGDRVNTCVRMELSAGQTVFIPGGWIHAVYTMQDTIMFGGNFLNSFNIEKHLMVANIEETTHVPAKFRFPFFTELLWYVLERFVHCLLGRSHLDLPEEEKRRIRLEKGEHVDPNQEVFKLGEEGNAIVVPKEHVHLTQSELHGIKFIIMYLHNLAASKKNVPIMLPDPIAVVKDIRSIALAHKDDCPDLAVTGKYIVRWSENDESKRVKKFLPKHVKEAMAKKRDSYLGLVRAEKSPSSSAASRLLQQKRLAAGGGNRRRRVRCKVCQACQGGDCQHCVYCKDMTKYGGPGRMKQTCEKRRCLHPQLPVCAYCSVCKLDGWYSEPKVQTKESDRPENPPDLFECTVCLDIVHPRCVEKAPGLGKVNSDLSNSWECAKCANSGFSNVPSRAAGKRSISETEGGGASPEKKSKAE